MSKATKCFLDKCKVYYDEKDPEGDGLTITEFNAMLEQVLGKDLCDKAVAEIFCDIDDDSDKKMSWEEFKQEANGRDPKSVQASELKQVFERFDVDGSGRLSLDEIRQAFREAGVRGDPECSLEAADKDGDGRVSVQEFIDHWMSYVD